MKNPSNAVWNPARRALLAFGFLLIGAMALGASPARAATPAESFVQVNVQKGFDILNNKSLSPAERDRQFRAFLLSLTDIPRIALFTLGNGRRTATPAEIAAFTDAFRDYATAIYQSRLSKYSGQTLRVTGSQQIAPGDTVVTTNLVDPTSVNSQRSPLQVGFRVDGTNHFTVKDVSVEGVWLAIEQRDQFAAFLSSNGGNVPALTAHIQKLTQQLQNGGATTTNN